MNHYTIQDSRFYRRLSLWSCCFTILLEI